MTFAGNQGGGFGEAGQRPLLTRHADDPYTWALEQTELLRTDRLDLIDAKHIADEIDALVHYLADKLSSDLSRVLQHLLKWDHQPQSRTRSWALSIEEHRRRVARHLRKAPGLNAAIAEILADAYANGRRHALDETGLPRKAIPEACPYDWDEIMTRTINWSETP